MVATERNMNGPGGKPGSSSFLFFLTAAAAAMQLPDPSHMSP